MGGGGEHLAEPLLLTRLKEKGGQEGEGHRFVRTFTVSDISGTTSYVFDLKKLQKKEQEERRKNNTTFLAEISASPKPPSTKGQGCLPAVCGSGKLPCLTW